MVLVMVAALGLLAGAQAATKAVIREKRCATCEYVVQALQKRLSDDILVSFKTHLHSPVRSDNAHTQYKITKEDACTVYSTVQYHQTNKSGITLEKNNNNAHNKLKNIKSPGMHVHRQANKKVEIGWRTNSEGKRVARKVAYGVSEVRKRIML